MEPTPSKVLDDKVRLSETILWDLQRAYYEQNAVKCWQECVVPNFITSNAFIAHGYARVIAGFLRDYLGPGDGGESEGGEPEAALPEAPHPNAEEDSAGGPEVTPPPAAPSNEGRDEPVYIIELGAGAAKLSYVLIKKLLRLARYLPPRGGGGRSPSRSSPHNSTRREALSGKDRQPPLCFKYVVTDFSGANFDFWLNHPRFQPLLEAGVLDVGTFDAENGGSIRLAVSGVELRPGELKHPVICVANYVFDSLRQDAFRVADGRLEEVLCTTAVPESAAAMAQDRANPHPELLRHVQCTWSARACDAARSYPERRRWCEVLAGLCEGQTEASFLLPVGALQALEHTRALSRDRRMLLLAGDKGYASARELAGARDPHVAMHGSFSCMVNFRALHLYAEQDTGFAEHGGRLEGFKCCALGLGLAPEEAVQARMAFRSHLAGFGPDGFSTLQRCLKEEARALSLRTALAVLRLSHFDSDVFYKFKQVFIDKVPYAADKLQDDVRQDMLSVYDFYFPLQPSKDVAFELGRILMGLKDFEQAAAFFRDSQRFCGVHHVSWYNMGVCHYYRNALSAAEECFDRSLALCSDYPDALKWRDKLRSLQEYLGGDGASPAAAEEEKAPAKAALDGENGVTPQD